MRKSPSHRSMKIVFFDIDGVLNTRHTPNPRTFPYVADKKLVRRFRRLLAKTRAKAVLISTWRYDPAGLFSARHHGIPFIGCTPDLPHKPRRDEILAWLKQHPGVTRYAVLDDEDDELDALPLFQPSPSKGLTPVLAKSVADYLLGRTNADNRRNAAVRLASNIANLVTGHAG
jgi:FMN phosphatase YigB (HAD superfamily)